MKTPRMKRFFRRLGANPNPLALISEGMRINPQITRVLFGGVVLCACVALGATLVSDPKTAIIGGLLLIIAAVILILVAAVAAQQRQLSTLALWFGRFVALMFVAGSLILFFAWVTDWPRSLDCLLNPMSPSPGCKIAVLPSGPACFKPDQKIPSISCGNVDGEYVVTNVRWGDPDGGLNVRASPDIKSSVIGVLPPNATQMKVFGECKSGWCSVECSSLKLKGWSRDRYLGERTSVLSGVTGIREESKVLSVRNGPDGSCSAVEAIPYNAKDVIIHSCQESPYGRSRWCLVTYDKLSGWVPLEHLSLQQ